MCRLQRTPASQLRRATLLLLADESQGASLCDRLIAERVGLCERQVVRIRQKYVRDGLSATLSRKVRATPPTPPKLDGQAEAQLVALCCSTPPEGRQRWTLQLLADELGRLEVVASVSPETVRKCLKKTASSRGPASGSASPRATGRGLSPTWKKSSTSTAKHTTTATCSSAWTKRPSRSSATSSRRSP